MKAVVLISGGLDSATTAAIAIDRGLEPIGLSINYGQRHSIELEAALRVACALGIEERHSASVFMGVDSALTSKAIDVPAHGHGIAIPPTYVPARNLAFLSIAVGLAESVGAGFVFYGANAVDYSGYPDCRPAFVEAFHRAVEVGTKRGVEGNAVQIVAPLIDKTKAEIIRIGLELGVDYGLTWSCYDPQLKGLACGRCDSCVIRKKGFEANGLEDPIGYAS